MTRKDEKRNRRSIRLPDCTYGAPGAYFITLCVKNHRCVFGKVVRGKMRFSRYGTIVKEEWRRTGRKREEAKAGCYAVMPNHFHGILFIRGKSATRCRHSEKGTARRAPTNPRNVPRRFDDGTPRLRSFGKPTRGSLSAVVRGFKSAVTHRVNRIRNTPGAVLWQRNYYERVVRDAKELDAIRKYILENPTRWAFDHNNPERSAESDPLPWEQDEEPKET